MSLVAVVFERKGSGGNALEIMFDSVLYTLALNASLNVMHAIRAKGLKFCSICVFYKSHPSRTLRRHSIVHIYQLQSQFESRLI